MNNSSLILLIYLLAGYLFGVQYAPNLFSSTITQTHWNDINTYAWLVLWPYYLYRAHVL